MIHWYIQINVSKKECSNIDLKYRMRKKKCNKMKEREKVPID